MSLLKFCNQGGFPCLEVVATSESGTVTTYSFNNHPFRQTNRFYGGFFVKFPSAIDTSTNTVQFNTVGVSGSSLPVYTAAGDELAVTDLVSSGPQIRLFFYDRDSNRIQILN